MIFQRSRLMRLALVAAAAWLFFSFVLHPAFIHGGSMKPAYPERGLLFYWSLPWLWRQPERGDAVVLRYAGSDILLLKRIIAFQGEIVEFRRGQCFVNGQALHEPYVKYTCQWDMPPRKVEEGCIYVMGDNRAMPIEEHNGGQIRRSRLLGVPLW